VSKPAITRALDRLSEFDLVSRKTDPHDRRPRTPQCCDPALCRCRDAWKPALEAVIVAIGAA
jgi:hypothetical protein